MSCLPAGVASLFLRVKKLWSPWLDWDNLVQEQLPYHNISARIKTSLQKG